MECPAYLAGHSMTKILFINDFLHNLLSGKLKNGELDCLKNNAAPDNSKESNRKPLTRDKRH